jgi:calcineurin-like phosphoesterase family protein
MLRVFPEYSVEMLAKENYVRDGVPVVLHGHQHSAQEYEDALRAEKDNKGVRIDAIVLYAQSCDVVPQTYFTPVEPVPKSDLRPVKKLDIAVAMALTAIKKSETGKLK